MTFNINAVYECLANGGTVIDYAKEEGVKYSDVMNWVYEDKEREKRYNEALRARGEYVCARVLGELDRIAFSDIRRLYSPDGKLLPMGEWPDDVARMVSEVKDIPARYDKDGNQLSDEGISLKMLDRLKALEMVGKNLRMFTDKVEVEGRMTLEDLVNGSITDDDDDNKKEVSNAEERKVNKEEESEETE